MEGQGETGAGQGKSEAHPFIFQSSPFGFTTNACILLVGYRIAQSSSLV